MDKIRRMDRLVILAKYLTNKPSHLYSLGEFADVFGCAKSTLSELSTEALKTVVQAATTAGLSKLFGQ